MYERFGGLQNDDCVEDMLRELHKLAESCVVAANGKGCASAMMGHHGRHMQVIVQQARGSGEWQVHAWLAGSP